MKVIARAGNDSIATVYIAENLTGSRIEFVQSVEPPIPVEEKWVNIVSTLYGCPVQCPFCDAGMAYKGKLSAEEILFQIDYLVDQRFVNRTVPSDKWKIQFARMGEPALNPAVLDVLRILPERYIAHGLIPSVSTVAPASCDRFFHELLAIKHELYSEHFQLQFSLHTTDPVVRRRLIPIRTWDFQTIADYGEAFFNHSGRKITLNFALAKKIPVDPDILLTYFSPDIFLIKTTPLNPTIKAKQNELRSLYDSLEEWKTKLDQLSNAGYRVIESIGELEENAIGSNCGQYIESLQTSMDKPDESYTYTCETVCETAPANL